MAKITAQYAAFLDAIRVMGIEPSDTRKVIIEADFTGQINVYVQQYGNDRVPEVVKAAGSSDMVVVWHRPPPDERASRSPELILDPPPQRATHGITARRVSPQETVVTVHRGDPKEQKE